MLWVYKLYEHITSAKVRISLDIETFVARWRLFVASFVF